MAIIKHRPQIRLYTDRRIVCGQPTSMRLVLIARAEVTLSSLTVFIERVARDHHHRVLRYRLLGRRLGEDLTLPEGESEFIINWAPPADGPPTHHGSRLHIDYRVRALAAVPWWPDRKREFALDVALPAPEGTGEPFVVRSESPGGASLEVGLGSEVVAPGGQIEGVLAVSGAKVRRIRMRVIGRESSIHSDVLSHDFSKGGVELPADELEDGGQLPFRFRLPDKAQSPSFAWAYGSVDWRLEVRADVPWSRDLLLVAPLTMVSELPPMQEGRLPQLMVGSERIRRLWTDIARRTSMVFDGESLSRTEAGVRVEVREDTVLGEAPHLVANLSWERSLGPKLVLSKNVGRRRRRGREGRFPEQSHYLFARLSALLGGLDSYQVGERSATIAVPSRGALRGPLLRFSRIALDLAGAVGELQRSMAMPPPLAEESAVWKRLARRLGGTLWPGPVMVTGTLDGLPVEIGVDWEARGEATQLLVRPPWTVAEQVSLRELAAEVGLDEPVSAGEDELRVALEGWPTSADEVMATARKLVALAQRTRPGGPFR